MSGALDVTRSELIRLLSITGRGPKRNGVFALLLLVQTCGIMLEPYPVSPKNHRKRLAALKKRLSSLSLPAQLRRAVPGAVEELGALASDSVPLVLQQLAAPAREAVGLQCGDLLAAAARKARSQAPRPAAGSG